MHEAVQREIEKERIRVETSDMVRRRVLEADVRRVLMMERDLALRRGSDGFPFGSSPIVGFDSPMGIPFLGTRSEGSSLEERFAFSLTERGRLNGRHESGRFESLPFQRRSAELRISEFKPVLEGGQRKGENYISVLQAKPDKNISGSKRKAPTPSPGVDVSEPPPDIISVKKAREDWSCALCQFSATSKKGLSKHLQEKEHKSKEAALRARRAGKNYRIGLLSKRDEKTVEASSKRDEKTVEASSKRDEKTVEASSKRDDDPLLLIETLESDNSKKNQLAVVQKGQKSDDPKKKKYRFCWEMCQVGDFSQKVIDAHNKGKKHESKEAALRAWRTGKNYRIGLLPNRDEKTVEASSKRDDPPLGSKRAKSVDPKKYRFWCEMCQVGDSSQKVMNDHMKGKKHVARLERINRIGGAGPSDQKEKIVMLVNREGVGRDGEGSSIGRC